MTIARGVPASRRRTAIAVTGHLDLTEHTVPLVRRALDDLLGPYAAAAGPNGVRGRNGSDGPDGPGDPDGLLVGVSCIAKGADTLFAEAVLGLGGRLIVVVPSRDYRRRTVELEHGASYDRLVEAAEEVVRLPYETAARPAYEAANTVLIERADRLVAVWDGTPPTGKGGGTADAVLEARAAGIPVDVVWPEGAARGG
ncbi:hypothetical protein PV379_18555 [Streptomyces caniscabiei]|uniref:hypothetical protein n=1 Tax=Streptomyces caniscabiei TaxID=2746961 RepID=UPI0029ABAF98|nr:hypothetical protein [Streptomyces caniscabiei]MDX2602014.1 hypothetical protein [Streptomyces caniscabiei]MDX2737449.1 hypothetical protein [Streptomyces caniscabiei]MDX2779306.1 hypothetical protein [Streptomyces caniscabiei]